VKAIARRAGDGLPEIMECVSDLVRGRGSTFRCKHEGKESKYVLERGG